MLVPVDSQNVEGPAASRTVSRTACGSGEHARQSESTYAQLVDMMSRVVAHKRLRDGLLENLRFRVLRAENQVSKTERVEGKISIVQSIQLDFLRSLGSATSNETSKRVMLRAEWTITASPVVLRLAQMKY